jgi:hypothetical protein
LKAGTTIVKRRAEWVLSPVFDASGLAPITRVSLHQDAFLIDAWPGWQPAAANIAGC